jgi:energy-coupling factor transporter ATP-binding protein EcfA2
VIQGVSREGGDDTPLFFHDHGRYAEIMATTARPSAFRRQSIAESVSPNSPNSPTTLARRTPSLVSFVGQAGAGKSTLIKLLILLKAPQAHTTPQCPVVGVSGGEVPTSEDVHLYFDPSTCLSDAPILYADCEGLDGGEREPLAAAFRRKRNSVEAERGSDGETSSFRTQYSSKRELQWAKSQTERTRHFAVSRFYPRLLFTFSDVVIFVHRNPR